MPNNASEAQVETLLAHEFVHWLQFHSDVADTGGFGGFVSNATALGSNDTVTVSAAG
jgi:hypothetical protein